MGSSSFSSTVEVVCPFHTKESFFFGSVLFVTLSLHGYQAYPWSLWGLFVVGLGKQLSFLDESTILSTSINTEEFSHVDGFKFYA